MRSSPNSSFIFLFLSQAISLSVPTRDSCSSKTGLVIYSLSDPCVNGKWRFERFVGRMCCGEVAAFDGLVSVVCMVVNWIPGQMALLDPSTAAGVSASFLVWQ